MHDVKHATLVAATVTTLSLDAGYQSVEVLNRDGAAEVFVTVDGTEPTVEGEDCFALPATIGALEVPAELGGWVTEVKLISSGTPKVTVTGIA